MLFFLAKGLTLNNNINMAPVEFNAIYLGNNIHFNIIVFGWYM